MQPSDRRRLSGFEIGGTPPKRSGHTGGVVANVYEAIIGLRCCADRSDLHRGGLLGSGQIRASEGYIRLFGARCGDCTDAHAQDREDGADQSGQGAAQGDRKWHRSSLTDRR